MAVSPPHSTKPKILTDDVELQPILDFKPYAEVIAAMIIESEPNFSIGIYGEWGTGKTTLMRYIEEHLKGKVLTVWFNAWRYEREDQLAIVALMKTIAYRMGKDESYKAVKPIVLRGLKILGKDFLRQVASQFVTENGVEEFENKLLPKLELLAEVDKETIYFDGINKIEEEMKRIRRNDPTKRVVVFIDDLDRCSPKKALEVFESIKVFLGIEGFIYIVGLSHETVSKLITAEYEKSGIKGEQYIKKIIQIPIPLPDWNASDIHTLIISLSKKLDSKYKDLVAKNADIIATAVENNPREIKRFINSFILANELHMINKKQVNTKELLVCQALNIRWPRFYSLLSNLSDEIRGKIAAFAALSETKRASAFETGQSQDDAHANVRSILMPFRSDMDFWNFLTKQNTVIFGIKNWETYRRATAIVEVAEVREQVKLQTTILFDNQYSDLFRLVTSKSYNTLPLQLIDFREVNPDSFSYIASTSSKLVIVVLGTVHQDAIALLTKAMSNRKIRAKINYLKINLYVHNRVGNYREIVDLFRLHDNAYTRLFSDPDALLIKLEDELDDNLELLSKPTTLDNLDQ